MEDELGIRIGGFGWSVITVVVLTLLFFMLCFRTVGAGQVGIITRFGEVDRTVNSGIALKLPWPFESIHKMNTQTQKEQQDAAAATSDLQDVKATLALNYSLERDQALEVFKNIGEQYVDRIITPALQESFKAATAKYTASELLTKREEVKNQALAVIRARLEIRGIRVDDLSIVNFSFSDAFNTAIEQKQVAEQDAQKAVFVAQKAAQEAQAEIERAKGQAEAQKLLNSTASDKTIELRQLEVQKAMIDKWNGVMPLYSGNGSGLILNLPGAK